MLESNFSRARFYSGFCCIYKGSAKLKSGFGFRHIPKRLKKKKFGEDHFKLWFRDPLGYFSIYSIAKNLEYLEHMTI